LPTLVYRQASAKDRLADQRPVDLLGEVAGGIGVVRDQAAGHAEPAACGDDELLRLVCGDSIVVRVVDPPCAGQSRKYIEQRSLGLVLRPGGVGLGNGVGDDGASGPPPVDGPDVLKPRRPAPVVQHPRPAPLCWRVAGCECELLWELGDVKAEHGDVTLVEFVHDHVR
jgi:hypothetical protein